MSDASKADSLHIAALIEVVKAWEDDSLDAGESAAKMHQIAMDALGDKWPDHWTAHDRSFFRVSAEVDRLKRQLAERDAELSQLRKTNTAASNAIEGVQQSIETLQKSTGELNAAYKGQLALKDAELAKLRERIAFLEHRLGAVLYQQPAALSPATATPGA